MKNFKWTTLSSLAALVLSSACHNQSPTSSVSIVRGRPLDAHSPALRNIVGLSRDNGIFCTGSIVAEDMVVTAAHCVKDPEGITIILGQPGKPDHQLEVESIETYKAYKEAAFPNFDIAWVKLKTKVPPGWKPMEILRNPELLKEASEIRLAGYGIEKTNCMTTECHDELLEANTEISKTYDTERLMSLLVFKGAAEKGFGASCNGDSGGPAYAKIKDLWYLVGVTNGATNYINPDSFAVRSKSCEEGSDIYTFMGDYVSWLENQSQAELTQNAELNPDREKLPMLVQGETLPAGFEWPTDWKGWLAFPYHNEVAWNSVQYILDAINVDHIRNKSLPPNDFIKIYNDAEFSSAQVKNRKKFSFTLRANDPLFGGKPFDLQPLAQLSNLEELELADQAVDALSILDKFPKLKSLTITAGSKAIDYSALKLAPQLESLTFRNLPYSAIKSVPWETLTSIKSLTFSLTPNTEQDIVDLKHVQNLESLAMISWSPAVRLTLAPGTKLKDLTLQGTVNDLNWLDLTHIQSIDHLTVRADSFSQPGLLKAFHGKKIVKLTAPNNRVTDNMLDATGFAELEQAELFGNQLSSTDVLSTLKALKSTDLRGNPLIKAECPANVSCRFDRVVNPKNVGDYCRNAIMEEGETGYEYSYTYTLETLLRSLKLPAENPGVKYTEATCQTLQENLASLTRLTVDGDLILNLIGRSKFDLRLIQGLKQLEYLELGYAEVFSSESLGTLESLKDLEFANIKMNQTSFMQKLGKLERLIFYNFPFTSLEGFSNPSVKTIYASNLDLIFWDDGKLETIGANADFPKLEVLSIDKQPLKDLNGIQRMRSLQTLFIEDTAVTDLSPLSGLIGAYVFFGDSYNAEVCPVLYGVCSYQNTSSRGPGFGQKPGQQKGISAFFSGRTIPGLNKTFHF